jgi:hypothetical protein
MRARVRCCAACALTVKRSASAERDSPTSDPRSLTVHGRATWPAGATARVSRISRPATYQFFPESVRAGGVAAGATEAGDEAEPYRVVADIEDDGRAVARGDCRARRTRRRPGDNDPRVSSDEIGPLAV